MFSKVKVVIGENQTSYEQNLHPYKAYMQTLLSYKDDHAANGQVFFMESQTSTPDVANAQGRLMQFSSSQYVEFIGGTMIDLFQTEGYLRSGIKLRIIYDRSSPHFYMLVGENEKDSEYKFIITKMSLYIPIIKLSESLLPHLTTLCDTAPARYFYTSMKLKQFDVPEGSRVAEFRRSDDGGREGRRRRGGLL